MQSPTLRREKSFIRAAVIIKVLGLRYQDKLARLYGYGQCKTHNQALPTE